MGRYSVYTSLLIFSQVLARLQAHFFDMNAVRTARLSARVTVVLLSWKLRVNGNLMLKLLGVLLLPVSPS